MHASISEKTLQYARNICAKFQIHCSKTVENFDYTNLKSCSSHF